MKIAYLIANFPVLSETFVYNEIIQLKALGHDVTVFSFKGPAAADKEKFDPSVLDSLLQSTVYIDSREAILALALSGLSVSKIWRDNNFFQRTANGSPNQFIRMARGAAVARRLKHGGFDWFHAHWPYACQVAHLAHKLTGLPYSISVHAHEVAHENGHFPLVMESTVFGAFCNRGAMNYLIEHSTIDISAKVHLIYHGVNVARFPKIELPSVRDELHVISAGRLTATKGFDRLVRACSRARKRGLPVKLTILGRGAEQTAIERVADEEGFREHLFLPGWVPQSEVSKYLAEAHIFSLLAAVSFHDGLPNVALEAMACGRPVILSPLPAASEAVEHGTEGFILKSEHDYDGFYEALNNLRTLESLLRVAESARARVVKEHDADDQIGRMVALFEKAGSAGQ